MALTPAPQSPKPELREQCADAVLMVRPAAFGFNVETAATNTFQRPPESGTATAVPAAATTAAAAARAEFEQLAQALASEGVSVCVAEDSAAPAKPDAVFPNNWLSFHEDGTLVLYPLESASRRPERRQQVIDAAVRELRFQVARLVDLSHYERQGKFLEGTGSLVLDHLQRVAYACLSPRTHPEVVAHWARELGYELGTWDEALGDTRVLVMSLSARRAFKPQTFAQLSGTSDTVLAVPVPTIERLGGGSVRCMLAEVFRPA